MEFSLLGAAVAAAAALRLALWAEDGRGNPAGSARHLADLALGAAVAGLVVGRVAAMAVAGTNPLTHPGDLLIVRGGVHTGAAASAALAAAALLARRHPARLLDGIAAAALAGLAGWHAGCLIRGACLGTPTGLPWGVARAGSEVARHPVEVYAALLLLAAAVALGWWKTRRPPPGVAAGFALAAAGAVRLVTEPMRPGIGAGPEWWYLAGIAVGAGAAAWAALRSRGRDAAQP